MINRRKFLKVFGLAGLAFSFLPTIFAGRSFSKSPDYREANYRVKSWLYGFPRRGCSTPGLTLERLGEAERGLQDFVSRTSHEQFLS
jgi:hypothetical protein